MTDDRIRSEARAVARDPFMEENGELKALLHYLTNRQTALEQRLERVEDSVVFRFLRWLGPKLGLAVNAASHSRENANQLYASWAVDTASRQHVREGACPGSGSAGSGPTTYKHCSEPV